MSCTRCIFDAAGFPQQCPKWKKWVLHPRTHELIFLEFDAGIVFVTDSAKLLKEKDMILLRNSTQTHVVGVCVHFSPTRNQFLYKASASEDI